MTPRDHALTLLKFARDASTGMLKDWPADKWTYQPSPASNHPLWVMAHIAETDAWIAGHIGIQGITIPDSFKGKFGMGSRPVNDAAAYPPAAEVRAVFESSRAAVVKWLQAADEAALAKDLSKATGGFTLNPVDACLKLAWHESWHFGQVATCRKELALPPVFG